MIVAFLQILSLLVVMVESTRIMLLRQCQYVHRDQPEY